MQLEVTDTPTMRAYRLPNFNLRWSGIFAGLVVGLAVNLLLMLVGATAGLAVFDVGDSPTGIPLAVAIWNALCMVVAAFAGGYVAARSTGMRRASDGVLHGVVAWGATMLLSALFATSATGVALGSILATSTSRGGAPVESVARLNLDDRHESARVLQERLGLTAEEANRAVDQALALSGREEQASPANREAAEHNLRMATVASGWLSAAIALSLLAAVGGGVAGARGARRLAGAQLRRAAVRRHPEPPPDDLSTPRVE
jgi:hypothetical protein